MRAKSPADQMCCWTTFRVWRSIGRLSQPAGARSTVADETSLDLAAGGLRQGVDELDDARVLVRRGLALHVVLQLARQGVARRVALAQHDHRAHDGTALLVGRRDRGGL